MSEIAIVKIRGAQDFEFRAPRGLKPALRLLGQHKLLDRIERSMGQSYMPQLTLPYLSGLGHAYNEQHGTHHQFTLIDTPEDQADLQGFDMAWFTVSTTNALATYNVADRLLARGVPAILGGIHASILPEEAGRHATSVVTGEAEGSILQVLRDFDTGSPLKPLYRGGRHPSLQHLPIPRWRDAVAEDYCPWVIPVQTSRGCRNACSFCSTTRFQGVARRHRPVADIVREIQTLQAQGVLTPDKTVFFTDNNIVYDSDTRNGGRDSRYSRELFEALAPLDITWVGQGEIGVASDPELVKLMASSGCYLLLVGLESISQRSVEGTGKRCNTVSFYEEAIDRLHRHGIGIIGCFIMGLDGDGPESFEPTRQFIDKWVDVPQLSVMTPFPGTALYQRMKREGRLLHEDWSRYDLTHVVHRPARMSAQELAEGFNHLTDALYTYPKALARALRFTARRTVIDRSQQTTVGKFTSILIPNIVYQGLNQVGLQDRQNLATLGEQAFRRLTGPRTPSLVTPSPLPAAAWLRDAQAPPRGHGNKVA